MKIVDITRFKNTPLIDNDRCLLFTEYPHIHIHDQSLAADVMSKGEGFAEVCCHGCGDYVIVRFSSEQYASDNILHAIAEAGETFIIDHIECGFTQVEGIDVQHDDWFYICPIERSENVETVDLTSYLFEED